MFYIPGLVNALLSMLSCRCVLYLTAFVADIKRFITGLAALLQNHDSALSLTEDLKGLPLFTDSEGMMCPFCRFPFSQLTADIRLVCG